MREGLARERKLLRRPLGSELLGLGLQLLGEVMPDPVHRLFDPGLEAVEEGDVVLKLISPLRPGLIESGDSSGFQYLIMPIRLNV